MKKSVILIAVLISYKAFARDYQVSVGGNDGNDGSPAHPLKTIGAAANLAMPGDTITVHAGVYRERVAPPRGGTDEQHRITYQAAPGEKVVITGSELAKGWTKLSGDAWKITLPNTFFGAINPFDELIYGSWYQAHGHRIHTGNVYLDGKALKETFNDQDVLRPVGAQPLWYATADGNGGPVLMNLDWIRPAGQQPVMSERGSAEESDAAIYLGPGHNGFGYLKDGSVLHYDGVDFGSGADSVDIFAASLAQGGDVEIHLDTTDGKLLGSCRVTNTGDWDSYKTFTIKLPEKLSGKQNLRFLFKAPPVKPDGVTVIHAQFSGGIDPNHEDVEISVRPEVFYPEKTGINYITVRGFTLCNAATNWAPPSAEQPGLIGPRWSRGWIIENNEILNSRCAGVSLGRPTFGHTHHYSTLKTPVFPEENGGQTVAQLVDFFERATWDKDAAGHHIIRNNHIAYCGQAGIVGCSGGAFSVIEGNDIHDIYLGESYTGQEIGCIKLHFAIDTIIRNNHLHRCGFIGMWLDWGAQGTRVEGNLFNENGGGDFGDLFVEVSHGPLVVDNNIFLSNQGFTLCSQGVAFVHNLIVGGISDTSDGRQTFYYKPHDTVSPGKHDNPAGDLRYYNNVFAGAASPAKGNNPDMPVVLGGNVYIAGASPTGPAQGWLMNVEWFKPGTSAAIPATNSNERNGTQNEPCSEGGQSVGSIRDGNWLRYDGVDFPPGTSNVEIRAAADVGYGGVIELHEGKPDGELLGTCEVPATGGWQKWRSFTVPIRPTSGVKSLCMVFHPISMPLTASEQAKSPLVLPAVQAPRFVEKPDGLYLDFATDPAWREAKKRDLITTALLGKAVIPNCAFENPDASPLMIDTDYFGNKRDTSNPFPGPFEVITGSKQTIKIWPKTPNTEIQ